MTELQQNGKYLYFDYEYSGGLDSKIYDLELLIRVALSLRRILIIKEAKTCHIHRFDDVREDVPIDFTQYIDLSSARIFKTEPGGIIKKLPDTLQYVNEKDFDFNSYSKDQVRWIDGLQLYEEENEKYPLICMIRDSKNVMQKRNEQGLPRIYKDLYFIPRIKAYFKSPFYVTIPPSKNVEKLSDIVINHLGTERKSMKLFSEILYDLPRFRIIGKENDYSNFHFYACIHVRFLLSVRRVSRKIRKTAYLRRDIEKVLAKVYKVNSCDMPLYIMSNIKEGDYFDFLKPKYKIYRYTDFKELVDQVTYRGVIDHNLLYSVEKNIMRYAAVKIFSSQRNKFIFEGPWNCEGPYTYDWHRRKYHQLKEYLREARIKLKNF